MKKSTEQVELRKTMAHVRTLKEHGDAVAAKYELEPDYSPRYVNEDYDTLSLTYWDTPIGGDIFVSKTIKRIASNTLQKFLVGDPTFGHSAHITHVPLAGGTELSTFIDHRTPGTHSFEKEAYVKRVYEKEKVDPSTPGVLIFNGKVINSGNSGIGEEINDPTVIEQELELIRRLSPDQLHIPEGNSIALELNARLVKSGTKSFNTIFATHKFDQTQTGKRKSVQFVIGGKDEMVVDITYNPFTLQRGSEPVFSPIAQMETVFRTDDNKEMYFSYYVDLSDALYPARVSASISQQGGKPTSLFEKSSIETPDMMKFLDEILESIAKNAPAGAVRTYDESWLLVAHEAERFTQPRIELVDGIDFATVLKALAQDI